MKHTPGPWETAGTDIRDKDGQLICDASICCPRFTTAEVVSNARLIASAPDLLAAVRAIERFLDNDDVRGAPMKEEYAKLARGWLAGKFGAAVRAAIEKAGG